MAPVNHSCRYSWEAHYGGRWAALVCAGIPFGIGAFSLFVSFPCSESQYGIINSPSQLSTIAYLVDVYQARAAASGKQFHLFWLGTLFLLIDHPLALAANGVIRYILGATFPLFTVQMYQNLGVHWAGSVFSFLSLFLLPIPWLLFKYGSFLRQKGH